MIHPAEGHLNPTDRQSYFRRFFKMKNNNGTGMVLAPNAADIISRQLKLDRNTFVKAVELYNSLTQFGQEGEIVAPSESADENTGSRGRGRPKGSKNKKRGPGRPKAKRGPGRPKAKAAKKPGRPKAKRGPGRPKGSTNKTAGVKRKTVKGGVVGKRGRKPKNANGLSLRDAVTNALRNANGAIGTPAIVEQLQKHGFNSKSLSTQVAQELSRMVKAKDATRAARGQYAWSGSPTPVSAVTTPAESEQHA
jgi:hypothetical protein